MKKKLLVLIRKVRIFFGGKKWKVGDFVKGKEALEALQDGCMIRNCYAQICFSYEKNFGQTKSGDIYEEFDLGWSSKYNRKEKYFLNDEEGFIVKKSVFWMRLPKKGEIR